MGVPAYVACLTFAASNLYKYQELENVRKNLKAINDPEHLKKIERMKKKLNISEDIAFFKMKRIAEARNALEMEFFGSNQQSFGIQRHDGINLH